MSDGGDCGGFGGDFGGHFDGGCHHGHDGGSYHHHYYDGGAGYYYYDGTGAEGAMGASAGGEVQKKATLMERISAMSGWQKVGAVIGVAAVVDGVRRIFAHRPSSLKEDATPEEKQSAVNHQIAGVVEGAAGGLWTAKILEDAGKAAIRRL